jgi:hypothetical protein
MVKKTFKTTDDTLPRDAVCSSKLDYAEKISWVRFLNYFDDLA